MRIKKHSNGNKYVLTKSNMWVRDFNSSNVPFIDINNTINSKDHFIFLQNEIKNNLRKYTWIDSEDYYIPKIVIVSDGYNFKEKHKILDELPKDVIIFGINGALNKWENKNRMINYYIINNPYEDCMRDFPRKLRNFPKCIASPRTNFNFLENYRGIKMRYYPVNEKSYTTIGNKEVKWQIDDYRNPVCAAIGLAFKFNVEKLMLFCCDDSFKEERPGAILLENNLWQYPQQKICHDLIDANLFWLKNKPYQEIEISSHSSGLNFEYAPYIDEDNILSFFKENYE